VDIFGHVWIYLIAGTFSIVGADVLFNALPATARPGKKEPGHGNCSGNVQFISVHFFLPPFGLWKSGCDVGVGVAPLPTIDVDVAYFRFWHVATLTFGNCPCLCLYLCVCSNPNLYLYLCGLCLSRPSFGGRRPRPASGGIIWAVEQLSSWSCQVISQTTTIATHLAKANKPFDVFIWPPPIDRLTRLHHRTRSLCFMPPRVQKGRSWVEYPFKSLAHPQECGIPKIRK